jgi:lysozyme
MTINVVADISHYNNVTSFETVKAGGIVGIVHKATQGTTLTDHMYAVRKPEALAAGLWWGAYHFGQEGDGIGQAKYFLEVVKPGPTDLLMLDWETNPTGGTMTVADAEAFVKYVEAETGRWPGVYGGDLIKELLGPNPDTPLSFCWFWLAEYGPAPRIIPAAWKTWTMWQYTDGSAGPEPRTVAGIGPCDRDQFNGDMAGLQKLWGYAATESSDTAAATSPEPSS